MLPLAETAPGWEVMTGVRVYLWTDPSVSCQESKALLLGQKPLRHCLRLELGPAIILTTPNYVQCFYWRDTTYPHWGRESWYHNGRGQVVEFKLYIINLTLNTHSSLELWLSNLDCIITTKDKIFTNLRLSEKYWSYVVKVDEVLLSVVWPCPCPGLAREVTRETVRYSHEAGTGDG